jgi:hypothetical protein
MLLLSLWPEMLVGMCMFTPVCNMTEQVTCHRYKPMVQGRGARARIVPVRTTHRKAYFQDYSTLYNISEPTPALYTAFPALRPAV